MPKHLTEEQKLSIRKKRNSEDRHSPGFQREYQARYHREARRLKRAGIQLSVSEWRKHLQDWEEFAINKLDSDIDTLREERTEIIRDVAQRAKMAIDGS